MAETPKTPRQDDPAAPYRDELPRRPIPKDVPVRFVPPHDDGDGYAVVGGDLPPHWGAPIPPISPIPPVTFPQPIAEPRRARDKPTVEARVDQIWSRGAEWGPNLVVLAIASAIFLYFFFRADWVNEWRLTLSIVLGGWGTLVILSYPMLVTLERPVRITPEQAVKDFYESLAHHLPHYRRMWLLLSSEGRISGSFSSFEGFKTYWKQRLAELRRGRAWRYTALIYRIDDFTSERNASKTSAEARFLLSIFVPGHVHEGPLASFKVEMGLVKGPDQMWYLNSGTLPGDGS